MANNNVNNATNTNATNAPKRLTSTGDLSRLMNNKLRECLRDYRIPVEKAGYHKSAFMTEESYQKSFEDIEKWLSTEYEGPKDKKFDYVIYHVKKGDGLFSAAVAWHFMSDPKVVWKGISAGRNLLGRVISLDEIKGRRVLVLDLSFDQGVIDQMRRAAEYVVIIDDHPKISTQSPFTFVGEHHSACAYTWKFFYPEKPVPLILQAIDSSDRKLFLPFIGPLSSWAQEALGYKFIHDARPAIEKARKDGKILEKIWAIIGEDDINFWSYLGKYMREALENLRYQIAINAHRDMFLGHPVAVMNLDAPNLTKQVAREVINIFKQRGKRIEFVVMYAYQGLSRAYHVELVEEHLGSPKYNLGKLAEELGRLGGDNRGGGGDRYVGSFFWKHIPDKQDIWMLFKAKSLDELKKMMSQRGISTNRNRSKRPNSSSSSKKRIVKLG